MTPPGRRSSLADGFCLTGGDVWSSRIAPFAAFAAQAFAGKLAAMSIVEGAIEDRVGAGGPPTASCQRFRGLESHDHRAAAISLFENFEEFQGDRVEGFETKCREPS